MELHRHDGETRDLSRRPIGSGKTTLGRALAQRLLGGFIDGDDFSDPDRPWFCSILRTSRAMVQEGMGMLQTMDVVVIAYPLGCMNWIYFRRRFVAAGVNPFFVSLRASYAAIVDESRGRVFSTEKRERIWVMITEGYGARPFSDFVVDTDKVDIATTLESLEHRTRRALGLGGDTPS